MPRHKMNIAHLVPDARVRTRAHGLHGYREVIESIRWGLADIGCDVTVSENRISSDRINVIVGAQTLKASDLEKLPTSTIIYNFEQIRGLSLPEFKPEIRFVADHLRIWEYSEGNMENWKKIGPASRVIHVPVGWAPVLNRIEKHIPQDIDVLIYGTAGQLRLQMFQELSDSGMTSLFLCGMYGTARDELIGRAKLVLNLNLYDRSRIFEIVRVSYLLANAKAVVADIHEGTFVEPGLENAVAFARPEEIRQTCEYLLDNDEARLALENRGREIIERRHVSPILRRALEQSGLG